MKKIALFAAGAASQRFMTALQEQQEVMADLADIIMQVYGLESALLRARKLAEAGRGSAEAAAAMTGLLADESMAVAEQAARRVLAACAEGDLLRTQLAILRRLRGSRRGCGGTKPDGGEARDRAGTVPDVMDRDQGSVAAGLGSATRRNLS